jgi:hypothetical protein
MNLADMLTYADIAQLTRIADVYRCECDGHSKHELIQSILQAVNGKEGFEEQIGSLALEDIRFLNTLLFDERTAFSVEDLIARVRQSQFDRKEPSKEADAINAKQQFDSKPSVRNGGSKKETNPDGKVSRKTTGRKETKPQKEAEPRDTIVRFKQYGWLFNGYSGPGRYLLQVPDDLKIRFREALERKFQTVLHYTEEPSAYRDEQELMAEDAGRLLGYIRDNDVSLTTDGIMYKRQILQLQELFAVREDLPPKGAWRFGYGRRFKDYPDRMALLYDYCHFRRWIVESDLQLMLSQAGEEKMIAGNFNETEELYRFWLRLYRRPIPNLSMLAQWVSRLAERWVTAESLQSVLVPFVIPFYYDSAQTVFRQRIIVMMLHLGLLRIGGEDADGQLIKVTKLGRAIIESGGAAGPVIRQH